MISMENFNDSIYFKQTRCSHIANQLERKAPILVARRVRLLVPPQRPLEMLDPIIEVEAENLPYIPPHDDKLKRQLYVADQKARKSPVVLVPVRTRLAVRPQRALLPIPEDIDSALAAELEATFIGGSGFIASSASETRSSSQCCSA
jgi:hypothetical protein